jgi:hypothetical protein
MVKYDYLKEVGFKLIVEIFFLPNVDKRFLVVYPLNLPGISSGAI